MESIYLDYNATTPVHPAVLEKMLPYFSERFGNASSKLHRFGWQADEAVKIAREQTSNLIHSSPEEIVFTSGATESINLAIKGVAQAYSTKGKHIVALSTEHKAVLDALEFLASVGFEIELIPVNRDGIPNLEQLSSKIRPDTILVCAMLANNETGIILPIEEISAIVHQKNSLLLCDATQACGKIPVDVNQMGIDLLALSSHKFYGPKGVGTLYVRRKNPRVSLIPLLHGGQHESGIRSGTLNVPGIVGMGAAADMFSTNPQFYANHCLPLRLEIEKSLSVAGCKITAHTSERLPNTVHVELPGIKADRLIPLVPELAFSTGSACSSALAAPSHVTLAMGFTEEESYASIRISLGIFNTIEEIKKAGSTIITAYQNLRSGLHHAH
jgi:cysteine desulfurase